jgi:hypothetical protein
VTTNPNEEDSAKDDIDFALVGPIEQFDTYVEPSVEILNISQPHVNPEVEVDGRNRSPTKPPASVGKKKRKRKYSRPKRRRSMGRYPWRTYSRLLIEERRDWSRTKEGTVQAMERRLRYLEKVVMELKDQGRLSSANPAKLTEKDIGELFRYFREERASNPLPFRSI